MFSMTNGYGTLADQQHWSHEQLSMLHCCQYQQLSNIKLSSLLPAEERIFRRTIIAGDGRNKTEIRSRILAIATGTLSKWRTVWKDGEVTIKAVFAQRSLSDLTLDQSKVRSDKVCVNMLNRIGKPDR